MLTVDVPADRVLNLRRRRARLPWIYLVYQEAGSSLRGEGKQARRTRTARRDPCLPHQLALAWPPPPTSARLQTDPEKAGAQWTAAPDPLPAPPLDLSDVTCSAEGPPESG